MRTAPIIACGAALLLVRIAGRRRCRALDRRVRPERRSGERDQGVADAQAGQARPAREEREAPGLGRPDGTGRPRASGPAGPIGPAGPQGPRGATGPAGPGASKIAFDTPANTPAATILTFGGLILRAACSSAGDMSVDARSTLDNARLHVAGVDDTGAFYREDDDLDAGADSDVLGSNDDDVAGTIVYRTPTGSGTVSVSFLGEEYSIAGVARCQFAGTAVAAQ